MWKPTAARNDARLRRLGTLCGLSLALACCAAPEWRGVANAPGTPRPVNQLTVAGNACGPAALLNAYQSGSPQWNSVTGILKGETDRGRLNTIIRSWGLLPSATLPGRKRWTTAGVNADDLCSIANEINDLAHLPELRLEVFMAQPGESPRQLLVRAHHRLGKSLAAGFPPVASVRRLALRGTPPEWTGVQGHFVTITGVQGKLPRGATEFQVSYIDPWGGRQARGVVRNAVRAFGRGDGTPPPCLETVFPETKAGMEHIRASEPSELILATGMGRW